MFVAAHRLLLAGLFVQCAAFICIPSMLKDQPTQLQEGSLCGGTCGEKGSCASGLKCKQPPSLYPHLPIFGITQPGTCTRDTDGLFSSIAAANGWKMMSAAPDTDTIELTFWVKMTHTQALKDALKRVSDPDSPDYGHYMSKNQVDSMVAPRAEDIAAVKDALRDYKVKSIADGAEIRATVPIAFANSLFGGRYMYFCRGETCALRNPSGALPEDLAASCDMVTPLNDPLPPKYRGPIIRPIDYIVATDSMSSTKLWLWTSIFAGAAVAVTASLFLVKRIRARTCVPFHELDDALMPVM